MVRRCYVLVFTLALLIVGAALAPQPAQAQKTFNVDSRADNGDAAVGNNICDDGNGNCTLRAALQEANDDADRDVVDFSQIPTNQSGIARILLSNGALLASEDIDIAGETAPNYPSSANGPIVVVDGSNLSSVSLAGLQVNGAGGRVEGLSVVNMPGGSGIIVDGDNVSIVDCFVGLTPDGTTIGGNEFAGINIRASGATISGNVVSGNGTDGIRISGAGAGNATLTTNRIGLDADGDAAKGNGGNGVFIGNGSSGNQIGTAGTIPQGNTISANGENGVFVRGDNNTVAANTIGTSADGSTTSGTGGGDLGNGDTGVKVAGIGTGSDAAENNVIGGDSINEQNLISGNNLNGITLGVAGNDLAAAGTTIRNNIIGLNANQDATLPNGNTSAFTAGIFMGLATSSSSNVTTIAENVVSGNVDVGIFVFGDTRNVEIDIRDNLVGTAPDGSGSFATGSLGNSGDGIVINVNPSQNADQTQVVDNIIGNNGSNGILIQGSYHEVANNFIGVAPDNTDIGNVANGILVQKRQGTSAPVFVNLGGNLDGDFLPGDGQAAGNATPNGTGNVIGLNAGNGIRILDGTNAFPIEQNYIGTTPGDVQVGNGDDGIFIDPGDGVSASHVIGYAYGENGSDGSTVALEAPDPADGGFGNVIAYNSGIGIGLGQDADPDLQSVAVRGNIIYENDGLGIDLVTNGVSSNDDSNNDADTGPNNLQNFPVINSVNYNSSSDEVTIDYTVFTSSQNANYGSNGLRVDFYAADSDLSGEGKTYLTTQYYNSPSSSKQTVIDLSNVPNVDSQDDFVATVTDADGNTSEFLGTSEQLPVELASFEVTQSGPSAARLAWTTATETNSAGFRVQHRAQSDSTWSGLGFVESKAPGGTTTEATTYRFAAEDLSAGTHEFRLKQRDLDGTAQIHGPVAVELQMRQPVRLSAPSPHPIRSAATVSFAVKQSEETTLRLYNVLGQRVATVYRGTPAAGETQTVRLGPRRLSRLSSGTYVLRLRVGGQTRARKITIVR